jgi:hypothetical protein
MLFSKKNFGETPEPSSLYNKRVKPPIAHITTLEIEPSTAGQQIHEQGQKKLKVGSSVGN